MPVAQLEAPKIISSWRTSFSHEEPTSSTAPIAIAVAGRLRGIEKIVLSLGPTRKITVFPLPTLGESLREFPPEPNVHEITEDQARRAKQWMEKNRGRLSGFTFEGQTQDWKLIASRVRRFADAFPPENPAATS